MLELLIKQGNTNISADIFDETTFQINYSIANIKDITNTSGTYTKTITLPDTPTNRKIFGYITDLSTDIATNYDRGVLNSYNPNLKLKCYVIEDSITVLEGYIQLTKYIISDTDNDKTIEATIYGDNASFYIEMGDKLLTDIDFSEFNFVYSIGGITASWSNAPDAYMKGYYFPLIDYGHGWTLDDLNNSALYNLNVKDFLPAVYVKTIWDKIFATNGFSYVSKFLGPFNSGTVSYPDSRFGNLVIPYYQQTFQNSTLFNQDKIFHLGLTQNGYVPGSTYSNGYFKGKFNTVPTAFTPAIVNAVPGYYSDTRNSWYGGIILNPFASDPTRNGAGNDTYNDFRFATKIVPFGLSNSYMFNNYVNGAYTFDETNSWYINKSGVPFKERFVLKTDVVTTISNNYVIEKGMPYSTGSATNSQGMNYIMSVDFYRSFDPNTGTTSTAWATGTGFKIPADLGGAGGICSNLNGSSASMTHWISDIRQNSNCFTSDGQHIVPVGSNRYLGSYCTNYTGQNYFPPQNDTSFSHLEYRYNSGDCLAWYYNDGYNQSSSVLKGLWVSGIDVTPGQPYNYQATWQPGYGDWYQNLQLQTIYLDGNSLDLKYGAAGSILQNGNYPIQPDEKVRVVVSFGSKYKGQYITSTSNSYKPPICGYLVSNYNFQSGTNSYTAAKPATQFYNDVSNDYVTGMTVKYNDIIPKNIKQRDFVQDIIRMHNLYLEPNKDNNKFPNSLIIEPRNDYYAKATTALDWRNKLDISQPIDVQVLAETQYKRTVFTYKTDGDWYNKQYTQNTNEVYGQFIYVLDNEFLISENKIESLFAPTPLVQLFSQANGVGGDTLVNSGGFVIPVLVSGSGVNPNSNGNPNGSVQTGMRILYKNYISNKNTDTIKIFGITSSFYPYAGPYDTPYQPTYTVNWGQTLGEFFQTPTDQFFSNLVNTYWATLLLETGDRDSRLITCQMFLTAQDINNFYFYQQVWLTIDNVDWYYKVNSIEGYIPGQNALCTVTLLKSKVIPSKQYQGSTTLSGGGVVVIPPSGGGGGVITPPSSF